MAKCLVTGGAGFIGSNLVDRLIELNHEVIAIDNESSEVHEKFYWNIKAENHKLDICDFEKIRPLFEGAQYVFHLAAESRIQPGINNPLLTIRTNALGTATILQCSREAEVNRVIYSTTSSYYGLKNQTPNVETQSKDCLNPYSVSKVAGEEIAAIYLKLYGLKTISLRYFNVYGAREPLRGPYAPVIGLFLRQFKQKVPVTIVGDGKQRRDFTHIEDVIKANLMAAFNDLPEDAFGQTYNVGSGTNYSMIEIAEIIGASNHEFIAQRPGEARETLADISKIKNMLGWKPEQNLQRYLEQMSKS
jgi:UDP-glucose 4-epimerase